MSETNIREIAVGIRPAPLAKAPVETDVAAAAAPAEAPPAPDAPLDLQLRGDPAFANRRSLVAVGDRGPLRTPALPARTGDPGALYRSLDDRAFLSPAEAAIGRALDGAAITADRRAGGTAEGIAKHGINGQHTAAARRDVVNGARSALLAGGPVERPDGNGVSIDVRGVSGRAEGNGCAADANVSTRGAVAAVSCAFGTGAAVHAELTADKNGGRIGIGVKIPLGK